MFRPPTNHPQITCRSPAAVQECTGLTQPPGPYSTHGNRVYHPPMGDWVVPPTPYNSIPQHRVFPDHLAAPKPPLHQSLTCHELRRPRHLQGWPASTCLRPNDLDTFRHAQGHPDSSSYTQTPQVHPGHLRSLQITCRSPADHPQITHSSTGTPEMSGNAKTRKFWRF